MLVRAVHGARMVAGAVDEQGRALLRQARSIASPEGLITRVGRGQIGCADGEAGPFVDHPWPESVRGLQHQSL